MGKKKIIISGTGRAGTSFIMQLLTELGLDTGFDNAVAHFDEAKRAGLEPDVIERCLKPDSPKISKSPAYCDHLAKLIEKGLEVEHIIIPVRRIEEVANSRIKTGLRISGSWGQQALAEKMLGKLAETVALREIPHTFVIFPKLVQRPKYLFDKLAPVFKWGPDYYKEFKRVYNMYVRK